MGSTVPKWFRLGAKNLACRADLLARVNGVFKYKNKFTFELGKSEIGNGSSLHIQIILTAHHFRWVMLIIFLLSKSFILRHESQVLHRQ